MNYWAILVAAASSFALGGLWYSPALFGRVWMAEMGAREQEGHAARVFTVAFGFSLVSALGFAWLVGPQPSVATALQSALLVGVDVTVFGQGVA